MRLGGVVIYNLLTLEYDSVTFTSPSHHVPSLTRVGLLGNIPTDLLQLSRNIDN